MASSFTTFLSIFLFLFGMVSSQLSPTFYATSCPLALFKIKTAVKAAITQERRMGASLLRLHFHDCFVNGCDGSILLDDDAPRGFKGEKTAAPNVNSVRGYEVIDTIKSELESKCPGVVSCADIVAVAARDAVVALGGLTWTVQLGRLDSKTANFAGANTDLPSPLADLSTLITAFSAKGFTAKELVTLSGAHTIGKARCLLFRDRIYNETNINTAFATSTKVNCPSVGGDDNLSPLDGSSSPNEVFDNAYFRNLVNLKGLLHSDQQLYNNNNNNNGASTVVSQVNLYSSPLLGSLAFLTDFAKAMVKMGNLAPPTGTSGEIRTNCRVVNQS